MQTDNRTEIRILGYVDPYANEYAEVRPRRLITSRPTTTMTGAREDWTLRPCEHVFPSDSPMRPVRWRRVPFVPPNRTAHAVRYF